MAAKRAVSVQVVNYHTRRYLERCLQSVITDLKRSGVDYEINLLDNASGERLDDLAARFPNCRTFVAERNLGFGGGHNLLASKTDAPYLLILNPDVELVAPDTASRLLDAITSSEGAGVVGPKLMTTIGTPQPYDHGRLHGLRAQIALKGGHAYWRQTDARQEVAWVSGAALLVERAAFVALGGFDENLFLYKEDEDLCLRLRASGRRVIYEPAVVVRHRSEVVADRPRAIPEAERYFIAKHCPNRGMQRALSATHKALAYMRL
jgi:GT2 family glycosyltransferase